MAGITLAQAEAKLTLWMEAEDALASSQSYEIESVSGPRRKLTRANLQEIGQRITYWQNKVASLQRSASGRTRTRNIVN